MVSEDLKAKMRTKSVHNFLYKLYNTGRRIDPGVSRQTDNKRKDKILDSATKTQMDVLIKLVRLAFAKQEITVHAKRYDEIVRSKKLPTIQKLFQNDENYRKLKEQSLPYQIKEMKTLCTYHQILYFVFNKRQGIGEKLV
jgi:hypothetical protein